MKYFCSVLPGTIRPSRLDSLPLMSLRNLEHMLFCRTDAKKDALSVSVYFTHVHSVSLLALLNKYPPWTRITSRHNLIPPCLQTVGCLKKLSTWIYLAYSFTPFHINSMYQGRSWAFAGLSDTQETPISL
jgi:hypothetical protein